MADLPSTDAEFNDYFIVGGPYVITNAVRFLLSAGNNTALTGFNTNWTPLWTSYSNDATRTDAITGQKTTMRTAIETLLRQIFDDIPESVLTPEDRATLRIPERDPEPSPIPKYDHAPLIIVDKNEHLQ